MFDITRAALSQKQNHRVIESMNDYKKKTTQMHENHFLRVKILLADSLEILFKKEIIVNTFIVNDVLILFVLIEVLYTEQKSPIFVFQPFSSINKIDYTPPPPLIMSYCMPDNGILPHKHKKEVTFHLGSNIVIITTK